MRLDKPIESITEADLLQLIEDKVDERRAIEYKQTLHGGKDGEVKEFLSDVASFANADGGDIIYGMREESSVPIDLIGFDIESDKEILRLETSIRSGVDPRIHGIQLQAIKLSNSKTAIILRVPKSWNSPHMLKNWTSRFFSRGSKGKYPLDVREIRSAFLMRENTANRIRDFHAERISRIIGGQAVFALPDTAKIALHIIPMTAFDPAFGIDVKLIKKNSISNCLSQSLSGYLSDGRFNIDGYVRFHLKRNALVAVRYLQLFRTGVIEVVDTDLMEEGRRVVPIDLLESKIIEMLPIYFSALACLGVQTPAYVMITLHGMNGYQLEVTKQFNRYEFPIIDRDTLMLPEILIDDFDCDIGRNLRPVFDALWQAAGWDGSQNYDNNGARKWRTQG
jgi:hypothetical protein